MQHDVQQKPRSLILNTLAGLVLTSALAAQQAAWIQSFAGSSFRSPRSMVTDGTLLYVSAEDSLTAQPVLLSMPLGGGPLTELYRYPGPGSILGLEIIGPDLFWIDPNSGPSTDTQIFRAPKAGGGPVTAIYTGVPAGEPIVDGADLATDGASLFSIDFVQGRLHNMDPDGSGLVQLSSRYGGYFSTEHLNRIDWYLGAIYLVDAGCACLGGPFTPEVAVVPDGGGVFTTLHSGAPLVAPTNLAVGEGFIYVVDAAASNTIWRIPASGGTPTSLLSASPSLSTAGGATLSTAGGATLSTATFVNLDGIVFDNGSLYVSDSGPPGGNGAIYRIDLDGVRITTVMASSSRVRPGQTGLQVTIDVVNFGTNACRIDAASPHFLDSSRADVSSDYAVVANPGNPVVIAAGATEQLRYDVEVVAGAQLGTITIDAMAQSSDLVTGRSRVEPAATFSTRWDVVSCLVTVCGDCNGDGWRDLLDALLASQHATGLALLTGQQFSDCNVIGATEPDPTAVVDVLDALALAQVEAGLPVMLACCP